MKKYFVIACFSVLLVAGCTPTYKLQTITEKNEEQNYIEGQKEQESAGSTETTYTYMYSNKSTKLALGRTASNGTKTGYWYDRKGNLVKYVLAEPGQKTVTYSYSYMNIMDATGNSEERIMVSVDGQINATYYVLDDKGRIAKQLMKRPNKKVYTVFSYTYNEQGYLTEVQDHTLANKRIFAYASKPARKYNPLGSLNNAILVGEYTPEYQPQKQHYMTLGTIEELIYKTVKEKNGYIIEEEVTGTLSVAGSHKVINKYNFIFEYVK